MTSTSLTLLEQLLLPAKDASYDLPAAVVESYELAVRLTAMTVDVSAPADDEAAAAAFLAGVVAGGPTDLLTIAAELQAVDARRTTEDRAARVLHLATEQARRAALDTAVGLVDVIISEHLRPSFERVLDEARTLAPTLADQPLDAHALLRAPTKVRSTYLQVEALAAQLGELQAARAAAYRLAGLRPEHDVEGQHVTFERPGALHPDWSATGHVKMPALPVHDGPLNRLLWLASEAVAAAGPWLPTVSEQDRAWHGTFGEQVERMRRNQNALAGYRALH